jgi:hypothetical protein
MLHDVNGCVDITTLSMIREGRNIVDTTWRARKGACVDEKSRDVLKRPCRVLGHRRRKKGGKDENDMRHWERVSPLHDCASNE